ncbi:MAG: RNA methyltransferase [Oscillospiraceae bacterium]|nr:RNA methyltransferase [Oscillospiraceae bacterium]
MSEKFISGRNNNFITEICKLKQKKYRNQTGLFYVEGIKLFKEVFNSTYRKNIRYIIILEEFAFDFSLPKLPQNASVVTVTSEVYKKITDEEAFQGVMCVIEKPGEDIILSYEKPVIILNSVRDPGNVGTVIRTANAVCGIDIILSEDCADIYSGKTQRAAMGAVFRQNIKISKNIETDIANLKKNGYNIFAAHLDKNSRSIDEVEFNSKTAVVFGNEGNGIDGGIVSICDEKIIIPINQNSESLNVSVAAAIVLWEMRKGMELK